MKKCYLKKVKPNLIEGFKTRNSNKLYFSNYFGGVYLFDEENSSKTENKVTETENKPKEKKSCKKCGKDLTDDYNRMLAPSGTGYFCTLCYRKLRREVDEELKAEGY